MKKDYEKEFIELCKKEGYELLSEYKDTKTKVKLKHLTCNQIFEKRVSNFKRGERCPYCSNQKRFKTEKSVIEDIKTYLGEDYQLLSHYKNNKTKLLLKHLKCNKSWFITTTNIRQGKRCPYCFGHPKKTTEEFKKEVYDLEGNNYTVLTQYKNSETKIKMKHNKCGNIYEVTPNRFLSGTRCPKCFGCLKKTTEEFKKEVYELEGNNYTVLSEYTNSQTKIKMKHNKCGYIYEVVPNKFLQGRRCPKCKPRSFGEDIVYDYLKFLNISFEKDASYSDLYYKNSKYPLKFDFKLIDLNGKEILIEIDGIQHFKEGWNNAQSFEDGQKRDLLKNEYCEKNNIPLFRINYNGHKSKESIIALQNEIDIILKQFNFK